MCGLLGWYLSPTGFDPRERAIMAELLIRESTRLGTDSWGFLSVHNGKPSIARGLGRMQGNVKPETVSQYDIFCGHTRARTIGDVTIKNAHPFRINNIVGAHNGIISNHLELNRKYKHRNCAVDSKHIFMHISESRPLDELQGWGACWYTNVSEPKRIYLFKSQGRLGVYGIGTPQNCKGVVFATCWQDAANGAEIVSESAVGAEGKWFPFEVKEDVLYYLQDQQLFWTTRPAKFGTITTPSVPYSKTTRHDDEEAYYGRQHTRHYRSNAPPVLTVQERQIKNVDWGEVLSLVSCDWCSHKFLPSCLRSIHGRLGCPSCVRSVERGVIHA